MLSRSVIIDMAQCIVAHRQESIPEKTIYVYSNLGQVAGTIWTFAHMKIESKTAKESQIIFDNTELYRQSGESLVPERVKK